MEFLVQNQWDRTIWQMRTNLARSGYRFGVQTDGRTLYLKTRLRPKSAKSRFGVLGNDYDRDQLFVQSVDPASPGARCEIVRVVH